jgi:large subunit ribosomal protein L9
MKIILLKEIQNLGQGGELIEVKDGYARNYLFPRKLAIPATSGNLNKLEEIRKHQQYRKQKNLEEAKTFAVALAQTEVKLQAKVGEEGKLFGSITTADIARALKEKLGKDLDKKKITLSEPIKRTGTYSVPVKLEQDVEALVKVEVVAS